MQFTFPFCKGPVGWCHCCGVLKSSSSHQTSGCAEGSVSHPVLGETPCSHSVCRPHFRFSQLSTMASGCGLFTQGCLRNLMVQHTRCGSSDVQVQCEAGEVQLQEQGSSSAFNGCSGDIVDQFSLIYAFPLLRLLPHLLHRNQWKVFWWFWLLWPGPVALGMLDIVNMSAEDSLILLNRPNTPLQGPIFHPSLRLLS